MMKCVLDVRYLSVVGLLLCLPSWGMAEQVSPCIKYERQHQNFVHITKVDLNCSSVTLIGTTPGESETTSNFAYRHKTTVAINGSFFDEHNRPLGLNYSHQRTWNNSLDQKQYSFLACTQDKQCFIEGFNRQTAYQHEWDIVISGWQSMQNGQYQCVPGSPSICQRNARNPHPRTAIGLSKDKRYLYLVVVEGRQDNFKGYTLNQLAKLFQRLDVPHAINLDGGGSSTMVINNRRVNRLPTQQFIFERTVANHLGVIDKRK